MGCSLLLYCATSAATTAVGPMRLYSGNERAVSVICGHTSTKLQATMIICLATFSSCSTPSMTINTGVNTDHVNTGEWNFHAGRATRVATLNAGRPELLGRYFRNSSQNAFDCLRYKVGLIWYCTFCSTGLKVDASKAV